MMIAKPVKHFRLPKSVMQSIQHDLAETGRLIVLRDVDAHDIEPISRNYLCNCILPSG